MEIGLFIEFQCPPGMDEARAFDESLARMAYPDRHTFSLEPLCYCSSYTV